MPSQKSTRDAVAVAPKRRRGHDRVEAIQAAATELFAAKPYDTVTMTEVAARSETAIGSLYRFFPTKEALADALLERYGALLSDGMDRIADRADAGPPEAVADALVDFMYGQAQERAAALALVEARPDSVTLRQAIRGTMVDRLALALAAVSKGSPAKARPRARLLLAVLKTIRALGREDDDGAAIDLESRRLVRVYMRSLREEPG